MRMRGLRRRVPVRVAYDERTGEVGDRRSQAVARRERALSSALLRHGPRL